MTNLEILTRLCEAGLLTGDESVTLARSGEAESVSLTMDHPVAFVGNESDVTTLVRRLCLAYGGKTPVYLLFPNGNILYSPIEEFNSTQWKAGAIFFFDSRKAETKSVTTYTLEPILSTMDRLLADDGCPWDKAQTHESLKTYFLQETYEVLDAIDKKDWKNLCEELGDVLYQIVFHARLAEKEGHFTMQDVVDGISEKMQHRHPFIFQKEGDPMEISSVNGWEKRKRLEKNRKYLLSGVSKALPSLLLACIIQKKVGSIGLGDILPDTAEDVKIICQSVLAAKAPGDKEMKAGWLLFAISCKLSAAGIEPELALRRFTLTFMRNLHAFEEAWLSQGHSLDDDPEEVLAAWRRFNTHPKEP